MPWTQQFGTRGPEGPQGPQGAQGTAGAQGAQGPAGVDGKSVSIAGQVATYANLPSNLGPNDAGKGYLVVADGDLYVWSGTAFPPNGSGTDFRGPQGLQGPQGTAGTTGSQGPQGIQGPQGTAGTTGSPGVRGSRIWSGAGAPGTVAGAIPGDWYIDTADAARPWYLLS